MSNSNNQTGGMLTIKEASQLLHVHSNTLRRWSNQGIVKAYRIGPRGDRRFKAEDIAVLLLEGNRGIWLDGGKGKQRAGTRSVGELCVR